MSELSAAALQRYIEDGCPECGCHACEVQTYVGQVLPIQGGEPVGKAKWVYDGDDFVGGAFEVTCVECDRAHYTSSRCPRCGSEDGLERALTGENTLPLPEGCPRCGTTDLSYFALVPAEATTDAARTSKARSTTGPDDPGFHGYRVDCRSCGKIAELTGRCPLCGAGAGG